MRRGDRTTWDAGSELMRAEQDHDEHPGEDMEMEDGDAVSTRSKDAESVKGDAASASGKEVKKRSRTLTTAHQTAVLNALLAKVSCSAPAAQPRPTRLIIFRTDSIPFHRDSRRGRTADWYVGPTRADLVSERKSPPFALRLSSCSG